ncbi:MAG: DUF2652 domain-containing protein [Anaerolineales bacterium]|nr:DUF2652 domain-containing protein [Anaerolineales bacterium]
MSKTHEGYLLIVDLTGYTRYLSESELEHAQETLTALLELLVENTRPPLVISRLAGDAVISYCPREDFSQGQMFIEMIEDTYVTFRKTLDRLVLNNTCGCNACANIGSLDLKFFIHYGSFGIQRVSGYDELVGNDINLLHRLLKNNVTEEIGYQAYALYTDEAIQLLNVEEIGETLAHHTEAYEHLGEVDLFVQDMHPIWETKRETTAVAFPYDHIVAQIEVEISMPRERVWDYLIQPEFRNTLNGSDRMEIVNRTKGHIAPGSVYQCYHGDKLVPQTILEWKPCEWMIVKELPPMIPSVSTISEYRLDPIEGGTRLIKMMTPPTGPFLGRTLIRLLTPVFIRFLKQAFEAFKIEIEKDYRANSKKLEHFEQEINFPIELTKSGLSINGDRSL